MRLFFIAFQFLTIIPLPWSPRCEERDFGRAMAFFPFVGLTLGLLLVGADFLLASVLPRLVGDLLLVVILSAATGVFHLDGLADVADGLAARGGRERFLAVMKDPCTGAAGAVAVSLALLLKYAAIVSLPVEFKREALLFFPVLSRYAQVQMTVGSQRARTEGLGALVVVGVGRRELAAALATALAAGWLLLGVRVVYLVIAAFLITWLMKTWFHRRLGGITGDIIGCTNEINEILCLVLLSGMASG